MEILKRKEQDATVISLNGRLDAVTSPELERELTEQVADGERFLVLDLENLGYISSAGLRTILAATKRLRENQGRLLLASLRNVVREVFEISGFSSIIPIFESVDAAVHSQV